LSDSLNSVSLLDLIVADGGGFGLDENFEWRAEFRKSMSWLKAKFFFG
jgi:hypothetical protein